MNNDQKSRILYVEDDETLSFVTKDNLELRGYAISHRADGKSALKVFKEMDFDICILDVMLPEMDGFELARNIRALNSQIPIIFLTAKSLKDDKIEGLRLGADDYITKPFSIEELILKVEVFLKRKYFATDFVDRKSNYQIGQYQFDVTNLNLSIKDDERTLTQRECDLLLMLIEHKNNVVKRKQILERIWGKDDYFLGRSLDVFISRLRKYLKQDDQLVLENVHGVGFRLNCP